jgi:signal transduction histidine kinase
MQKESIQESENARLRGDLLTVASRVSHDLRTPLGGMATAAEVLREILAEKNLPVNLAQAILDSSDDMNRLIKQINFVLRASADPVPKTTIRMNEIVTVTLQRLENQTLKKQAVIISPGSWPEVSGVATWLEMIWRNFVTNALQHTTDKTRVELRWREENGKYRFEICDNGGGVPPEIQKGLFHPFHTLYQATTVRGLGLSIVQRLVELQGGECGYEPKSGGSCFFFFLPKN